MLPTVAAERKAVPIATGFIDYFPDATAAVAMLSKIGNDQHNPGKPLHWDRAKSTDEADCLMRHFVERGTIDTDGVRHSAKVAWRAMALLQKEIEAERATPKSMMGVIRDLRDDDDYSQTGPSYDSVLLHTPRELPTMQKQPKRTIAGVEFEAKR